MEEELKELNIHLGMIVRIISLALERSLNIPKEDTLSFYARAIEVYKKELEGLDV